MHSVKIIFMRAAVKGTNRKVWKTLRQPRCEFEESCGSGTSLADAGEPARAGCGQGNPARPSPQAADHVARLPAIVAAIEDECRRDSGPCGNQESMGVLWCENRDRQCDEWRRGR